MKKNFSTVISAISCVLVVVCLFQIASLEQQISSLRNTVNNGLSNINNNVSGIHGTVSGLLEEQTNLLSQQDWAFGEVDMDSRSAELLCTIVPKEHTPGVTEVTMLCNGQEYPMTYGNGQYTAVIPIPLFETSQFPQVQLNDNGTIRTQALNWSISPRYEALLMAYANIGGEATSTKKDGASVWERTGAVSIGIERKGGFEVEAVEIVEILDGEEIGRLPVDLSAEGQRQYQQAAAEAGGAVPENVTADSEATQSGGILTFAGSANFVYMLDKEYTIPFGSMLEIYVDVVDGDGLRYRSFLDCHAVNENGEPDDVRMEELMLYASSEPIYIFDANGEILFSVDERRFS